MSERYWLEGSCTDPEEYDAFLVNMGNTLCDNWRDYLSPYYNKNE